MSGGGGERSLRPKELMSALLDHDVDLIVIGGYAVVAHGKIRTTKDIDICADPDPANLARLAEALRELEAESLDLGDFAPAEIDLEPDAEGLAAGGNWTLMTRFGRLDVMQYLEGLGGDGGYRELAPRAVRETWLGREVAFCSYPDLVRMKEAAGRPQDLIDLEDLRAARGEL